MPRSAIILAIAALCACSNQDTRESAETGATKAYQNSREWTSDVSTSKGCGPATISAWPPRPLEKGIVIDAESAKALGQIYFASAYGKNTIKLPLSAILKNGIWIVADAGPEEGAIGGNSTVEICQSNGAAFQTYRTQ